MTSPTTTDANDRDHAPPRGPDGRGAGRPGAGDGGVLLADALSVNAVTSGAIGLVLVVGAPWLDGPLGAPAPVLAALGGALVVFAAAIVAALARPPVLRRAAHGIVAADLGWVAAAAVVVPSDLLTTTGDVLLAAVSAAVTGFVVAQVLGLRRAGDRARLGVLPITLQATQEVNAAPAVAWELVADADGYAEHAPGIVATTTDGPVGVGMQRVCVDDGGRTWSETCTLVERGRRYRMEVDTTTYPLRYRAVLDRFGMSWEVEPSGTGGTRLTCTFAGGAKLGVLGRVAVAVLASDDPVTRIVARYATRLGPA